MITLYRRGRVFWAQSNFHGIRRQWSLKTRDREVAKELLRQAQLNELSGPQYKAKPFAEFEEEFLAWIEPQTAPSTLKEYKRVLTHFGNYLTKCGILEVGNANADVIAGFTRERSHALHGMTKRPVSAGGVKFELRVLHRVFSYALDRDYVSRQPVRVKNLNATAGKTQPFTFEEVRTMLDSPYLESKPYLKAIVLLFLHTGLRIGDVTQLQRSAIAGNVLALKTKKRGVVVRFPLHPDVICSLQLHFAQQNAAQKASSFVFSTVTGQPLVSLDKYLRRLWKACGIVNGHAHRFRDTFAVNLLERGASLYDVAKLLGNTHQVVEKYYAPYTKELQQRGAQLVSSLDFAAKT